LKKPLFDSGIRGRDREEDNSGFYCKLPIAGVFNAKYTKLLDDKSKVDLLKYPEINYGSVVFSHALHWIRVKLRSSGANGFHI
jgi:hypothetical protein